MIVDIPVKTCCGVLAGDHCGCLSPQHSAAEMAQTLRERVPIVLHTGPSARSAMARADANDPFLIAMRAAATNRFDAKGQPR